MAEVVGQGIGGGDGVVASLDLDGLVTAAGGTNFPDGPSGPRFDPAADGQGGEDDGQVGFERMDYQREPAGAGEQPDGDLRV